jgi:hypothetical protein
MFGEIKLNFFLDFCNGNGKKSGQRVFYCTRMNFSFLEGCNQENMSMEPGFIGPFDIK